MDINDIYLWLTSIKGISNNNIKQIESNDIDIKNLINYSDKEIYDLKNINTNIKENIVKYKSLTYLDKIKLNLEKQGVNYVSIYDELYPNNLKHIYDAPKILFYKGNLSILKNNINLAMVGSRKCTHYGINCAKSISKNLSDRGINIISGLVIGIDAYSHSGCLEGEGKTIAVLGSSLDNVLPRRNIKLSQQILDNGGLILSEYPGRVSPNQRNFPFRNRLITGLNFGEFSYVKDFIDFVISCRIKNDLIDISEEELNTLLIEFISQRKEQIEENYKKLEEQNLQQIIGNEKAKSEERHKKLQRILEKK